MDPYFTKTYSSESHPPFVPFAIRYMFAPPPPCTPYDFISRTDPQRRSTLTPATLQPSTHTSFPSVIDHIWENVTSESDVRSIYISGHINNNYGFDEFQNATLMPFEVIQTISDSNNLPLISVMPNLQQKSSELFSSVQNLVTETVDSYDGICYRTEKTCRFCKQDWGPQSEALGRAFLLRKLECVRHVCIRDQQEVDFERTLQIVPSLLRSALAGENSTFQPPTRHLAPLLKRISQLLFSLRNFLMQKRANRMVSVRDRSMFTEYERFVDETYIQLQRCLQVMGYQTNDKTKSWKYHGVYKHARCSEWVLPNNQDEQNTFKPEPDHLQNFGLMYHSSGRFSLGRQDDPNHTDFKSFVGVQHPMHTDMFQNDTVKGLASALAMIGNPQSLLGHGVYDRIKNPGAVIRCPSYPASAFFPPDTILPRDELFHRAEMLIENWISIIQSPNQRKQMRHTSQAYLGWKSVNFEMNDPDADGLRLVVFGRKDFQINFQTSMAHFISNIPLPGQGRLLLSSPRGQRDEDTSIASLYTRVQPYSDIVFPMIPDTQRPTESPANSPQPQRNNGENNLALNLPDLNVVWLITRHLGWTVDDDENRGSVMVDRRILIAVQWFSNTIMVSSLLASLLSRRYMTTPMDFFSIVQASDTEMR